MTHTTQSKAMNFSFLEKVQNYYNCSKKVIPIIIKTIFPNFQLFSSKNLGGDPKNVILRKTQISEKTTKTGEKIPKFGQNQISS